MLDSERQLVSAYLRDKTLLRPKIHLRVSNNRDNNVGKFGNKNYKLGIRRYEFSADVGMR